MFRQGVTTKINSAFDISIPKGYDLKFGFYQNGNRVLCETYLSDKDSYLQRVNEKSNAYFTCILPPSVTKNFVGNVDFAIVIFKPGEKDAEDIIESEDHVTLYFKPTIISRQLKR